MLPWFLNRIYQLPWSSDFSSSALDSIGCCRKSCKSPASSFPCAALQTGPSGTGQCWWQCCWPSSLESKDQRLLSSLLTRGRAGSSWCLIWQCWQVVCRFSVRGATVLVVPPLRAEGRNALVQEKNPTFQSPHCKQFCLNVDSKQTWSLAQGGCSYWCKSFGGVGFTATLRQRITGSTWKLSKYLQLHHCLLAELCWWEMR